MLLENYFEANFSGRRDLKTSDRTCLQIWLPSSLLQGKKLLSLCTVISMKYLTPG